MLELHAELHSPAIPVMPITPKLTTAALKKRKLFSNLQMERKRKFDDILELESTLIIPISDGFKLIAKSQKVVYLIENFKLITNSLNRDLADHPFGLQACLKIEKTKVLKVSKPLKFFLKFFFLKFFF